jgi:Uncharacterized protein conserved in bacteria (DUF2090)
MPANESKTTNPTESKSLSEARMTSEACSTVFMKWMRFPHRAIRAQPGACLRYGYQNSNPKQNPAGILVDEQFGAAILRDAAAHAYLTACPVEKSGQDEFDFDYGEDFAKHIEAFRPTLSKVLVRYNPEGDEALNQRQSSRLRRLSDYLHTESHRLFMFELLVPAEKAQLDRVKGDKKAYDLELRPGLMAQAIESSRMQELRRTSGKSRDSTVARIARGLWRLRTETAGTKLAALSSGGARTTRRCTNG